MESPPPPPRSQLVRLAVVVTALLAAALAGGLFVAGGWPKPNQSRALVGIFSPSPPAPSATPPKLNGHIPTGQPLVLYRRLGLQERPSELLAATWTGALYSAYDTPLSPGAEAQSPDGSKLLYSSIVYDVATARQLDDAPVGGASLTSALWGDDSRHICWVTAPAANAPVDVSIAGAGSPAIHLPTPAGAEWRGGNGNLSTALSVLACSPLTGVVVVAESGALGETTDVWVLSMTTGAVEYHQAYAPAEQANGTRVVASRDGVYLAETDSATGTATIRRWSDGAVQVQLAGEEVHAFSWDDRSVLVTARQPGLVIDNITFQNPALIDLQTGQAIWQAPVGARWFEPNLVLQPGGSGLALGLNVCATDCQVNLWLIGPNGKGRELDHNVEMLP
jgi:hypothetical protein